MANFCIKRFCIKTCAWHVIAAFAFIALILGFLTKLHYQPFSLKPYLHYAEKYLDVDTSLVKVDDVLLSYDNGLQLLLNNFSYSLGEGKPVEIDKAVVELSNHNLLLGRVLFKHINATGVRGAFSFYENTLDIAGLSFSLGETEGPGVVARLNAEDKSPYYKYLKSIELNQVNFNFYDGRNNVEWFVDIEKARLDKSDVYGERLVAHALLSQPDKNVNNVPVTFEFDHQIRSETAEINALFKESNTKLIDSYLPLNFKEILTGEGTISIGTTIAEDNKILRPHFEVDLRNGSLLVQQAFLKPLPFKEFSMRGLFDRNNGSVVTLDEVYMRDVNDIEININGTIEHLDSKPKIDLLMSATDGKYEHMLEYVPDAVIPDIRDWLSSNMYGADVSNFKAELKMDSQFFPYCAERCGINASFDYENLTVKFLKKVEAAKNVAGKFEWDSDFIKIITNSDAQLSKQTTSNVVVKIGPLFSENRTEFDIKGNAIGPLKDALIQVNNGVGLEQNVIVNKGIHVSDIHINFPLGILLEPEHFKYDVKSDLTNIETPVPEFGGKLLRANIASLDVNESQLKLKTKGTFDGLNVDLVWQEDMQQLDKASQIEVKTHIPGTRITPMLDFMDGHIIGDVETKISLKQNNGEGYEYDIQANLAAAEVSLTMLDWRKPEGDPLRLEAKGFYGSNSNLSVDLLALTSPEVEVAGTIFYNPKRLQDLSFRFAPLKIGNSNAQLILDQQNLSIEGKKLDITGLLNLPDRDESEPDPLFDDISMNINLDKIVLNKETIENFAGDVKRDDGKWHKLSLKGKPFGKSTFEASIQPINDVKSISVIASDAGDFLRSTDVYDNVRGGALTFNMALDERGSVPKGHGELYINEARIVNAPILARLISLLSIQELFIPKSGILFSDITVPFTFYGPDITMNKVRLNGPSIGLRFKGRANTENKRLDIKGQLIPAEGVNSLFSKIPLVGGILTGSQEGLLVADFSIDGTTDDPGVFVNPLSVVTPGIVKDFFNVITGGDGDVKPAPLEDLER